MLPLSRRLWGMQVAGDAPPMVQQLLDTGGVQATKCWWKQLGLVQPGFGVALTCTWRLFSLHQAEAFALQSVAEISAGVFSLTVGFRVEGGELEVIKVQSKLPGNRTSACLGCYPGGLAIEKDVL